MKITPSLSFIDSANAKQKGWLSCFIVIIVSIVPLFYNLGDPVLAIWDESRNAVNSYEMMKSGNPIVTSFNGEPDMWNTKPPLLQWLQVLSMKVFGTNEWALRFPSALSALLVGFLLLWFTKRFINSYTLGLVSVFVLYTSTGYINAHAVRTADFDSILVLFTTAASFFLFLATETEESSKKKRLILGFFIFITLAALTKGIAAFIMGPAYLVYLLYRRELFNWVKNPNFWIGSVILVVVVGGYYFLRNYMNPEYLQTMIENEISGRYTETLEENKAPFSFYIRLLYQMRFQSWYYLVPAGIILGFLTRDTRLKRLLGYLILLTVTYLLVISKGETKLMWYDLPIFPFISLMAGIFFYVVMNLIRYSGLFKKNLVFRLLPVFIILSFFTAPYFTIFKQNRSDYLPYQDSETHKISHVLREIEKDNIQLQNDITILYNGQFQHFLFYVYQLREEGLGIDFREADNLQSGKTYMIYQQEVMAAVENNYKISRKTISDGVYLVKPESH